jgi:PAS domain S-box-containing protein
VRILHLEDDPKDAELIQATLEGEGIACDITHVDTPAAFRTSLEQGGFDLVLADYTLAGLDGISALKVAKEVSPDMPFIFVSRTLGEEDAIEALKLGATDYVSKTRLSRIAPSVRRALREADERSQRQLAEQTLRESEAYLAEAQRLSQTGSWASKPFADSRYWSEECYRVLGFDPAGPPPLFEEFFQRIHPDDQAASRERWERAIRDKTDFEFGYRIVHPGKGVRDIHVVGHAVLDRSGNLGEFVGTVIDVTERKRAEQELQQLVDFVPQQLWVLNADAGWIYANRGAREYTGLTLQEWSGMSGMDATHKLVHRDDAERIRAIRQRGLAGGKPFELEARLLGKDGIYRWFLIRYNPWVEDGRVRRWYVGATEIESRKQEEERVRQENVRLEERTRIAQELHDTLLQTFQSALLHLGVALDGITQDSPVKPQLDRTLQIMRLGIDEGRSAIQGLRSSGTQASDLVVALSSIQQELEVQSDIDFRVVLAGLQKQLPRQIQNEIYRIGREALVNAFCHSGAKRVELELEYSDSQLRMWIRDNGCGIGPRVLQSGREGHWGLAGMRERTDRIGGVLNISSSATKGTEIQLSIPGKIAFQLSPADPDLRLAKSG